MKKVIETPVKATTRTDTILICDRCREKESKTSWRGSMHVCQICEGDVCDKCCVYFDWSCRLDKPDFYSDYPHYMCKVCWDKGEEIRGQIMEVRKNADKYEDELVKEWEIMCRSEQQAIGDT